MFSTVGRDLQHRSITCCVGLVLALFDVQFILVRKTCKHKSHLFFQFKLQVTYEQDVQHCLESKAFANYATAFLFNMSTCFRQMIDLQQPLVIEHDSGEYDAKTNI